MQLTARLKNFLWDWLLALGIKEDLVECATVCIKSEVILFNTYTHLHTLYLFMGIRYLITSQLLTNINLVLHNGSKQSQLAFIRNDSLLTSIKLQEKCPKSSIKERQAYQMPTRISNILNNPAYFHENYVFIYIFCKSRNNKPTGEKKSIRIDI